MTDSQKELNQKFAELERQINLVSEQLQAVEQQIINLRSMELKEIKKDNEILAQIGAGIFVKAKILSEELLVSVGEKNLVKKGIPETNSLIQNQIKKLEETRNNLNSELEKINQDITKAMQEHSQK